MRYKQTDIKVKCIAARPTNSVGGYYDFTVGQTYGVVTRGETWYTMDNTCKFCALKYLGLPIVSLWFNKYFVVVDDITNPFDDYKRAMSIL